MPSAYLRLPLLAAWRREFADYDWTIFRRDLLAGLTVGAVALPLALAFGVASGADAAAGLVTAILSGVVIAGLGGAAYQISGPTGAMIVISMRGVPLIDAMGSQALAQIVEEQHRRGGAVFFSGLQPAVREMFSRTGLLSTVGEKYIFWSANQAIMALHGAQPLGDGQVNAA
jgi:MFS superfamily sulfate permease-like transporter